MDDAQLQVYEQIVAGPRQRLVGVLRAALHQPALADLWEKFGAYIRYQTSVPPRLSELVILATARRWNSQVEWHVHAQCARDAGLPETVIDAIREGESPEFDDPDTADVYEFTRELQQTGRVGSATYQRVLDRLGIPGIVELTAIVGYYTLVSQSLNAHEIPLPDGVPDPLQPVGPRGHHQAEWNGLTTLAPARVVGTVAGPRS
jgi:4-carboxymuconolactone decarboxylase